MTKVGSKHKTVAFGADAERYLATLYGLCNNPRNLSRPDLTHPNNLFSIEVKSGIEQGILVRPQLRYHFQDPERTENFFEEYFEAVYPRLQQERGSEEGDRLYYCVIDRTNKVPAQEFRGDFAATRLTWGDQFLVPSEVVHHYFASYLAGQRKTDIQGAFGELKEKLFERIVVWGELSPEYRKRVEKEYGSWQGLRFRPARAIIHNDYSPFTNRVQIKNLDRFRESIESEGYEGYLSRSVPGPHGSTVHILYPSEDAQKVAHITRNISKRRKKLEVIAGEREEANDELQGRLLRNHKGGDCYNGGLDEDRRRQLVKQGVSASLLDKLERLSHWMDEHDWEESLEEVPF